MGNVSALGDVNTPCLLMNVCLLYCGVVRRRRGDNGLSTYSEICHWIYVIDACGIFNNISYILL